MRRKLSYLCLAIVLLSGCAWFNKPRNVFCCPFQVSFEAVPMKGTVPFDVSFHLRVLSKKKPFKVQFTDQPDFTTYESDMEFDRRIAKPGVNTFIIVVTDMSGWSVIRTINIVAS